jgi:hypothetical protein
MRKLARCFDRITNRCGCVVLDFQSVICSLRTGLKSLPTYGVKHGQENTDSHGHQADVL